MEKMKKKTYGHSIKLKYTYLTDLNIMFIQATPGKLLCITLFIFSAVPIVGKVSTSNKTWSIAGLMKQTI